MRRATAEAWIAFKLKLNGQIGTFLLGDPAGKTARGIATGTPLVKGASQTGNSLVTDGWTTGQAGILLEGDYIQIGSGTLTRLFKVLNDATSDGSGNATFDIWPSIVNAFDDNAAITVSSAVGLFRMVPDQMRWEVDRAINYGIAFQAIGVP
jgi:hypothetical protein